mmetsp:Transcript_79175/g.119054  ORF Transcript_79175/g.119054 Transcript_79175/m.119054 type:complete len:403 (+) Transcript_79175:112-1320(+)
MLVEISRNLLVESLVALVDVSDVRLFEFHTLSLLFGLLFDAAFHLVGQVARPFSLAGFVRRAVDGIERGIGVFVVGIQWSSGSVQALEVSFVIPVLAFGAVIVFNVESVETLFFSLFERFFHAGIRLLDQMLAIEAVLGSYFNGFGISRFPFGLLGLFVLHHLSFPSLGGPFDAAQTFSLAQDFLFVELAGLVHFHFEPAHALSERFRFGFGRLFFLLLLRQFNFIFVFYNICLRGRFWFHSCGNFGIIRFLLLLRNDIAIHNCHGRTRMIVTFRPDAFQRVQHGLTRRRRQVNMTEDNVLSIQMGCLFERDEELRSVRVLATVRHTQDAPSVVSVNKVFIGKRWSVNRLTPRTVTIQKVATLCHEPTNDAMKFGISIAIIPLLLLQVVTKVPHRPGYRVVV